MPLLPNLILGEGDAPADELKPAPANHMKVLKELSRRGHNCHLTANPEEDIRIHIQYKDQWYWAELEPPYEAPKQIANGIISEIKARAEPK